MVAGYIRRIFSDHPGFRSILKRIVITLLVLGILWFSFRGVALRMVAQHLFTNVEEKLQVRISCHSLRFTGILTIRMNGLMLEHFDSTKNPRDTLVQIKELKVRPALIPLFTGAIRISSLELDSGTIHIPDLYRTISSYRKQKDRPETRMHAETRQVPTLIGKMLDASARDKLFRNTPKAIKLKELLLDLSTDSIPTSFYCRDLKLYHQKWTGQFVVQEGRKTASLRMEGHLISGKKSFSMRLAGEYGQKVFIPGLKPFGCSRLSFDSLNFDSEFLRQNEGMDWLAGKLSAIGFELEAQDINTEPIVVNRWAVNFRVSLSKQGVETDSSTEITCNGFSFKPYINYQTGSTEKLILAIHPLDCEAQQFFDAVPEGLFDHFKGISVSGKLGYIFRASLDFGLPDSSNLISSLTGTDFRINHFGTTDFRMLNDSFTLAIYDDDQHFVRSMKVGSGNPDFVPIAAISPYLINAVLTSEDGSFFYHHGFNMNAIRDAMIEDIRKKRFARGGSTISMQLVKNVFLSKDKNLTRKLEEALIVWMIENQHLVSKERMLEVYLNIIEWGPGIYGIREASRFYFNKEPSALNLQESMFLAYIIPRPSSFRFAFEHNGRLRSYMEDYFELLEFHLLERENIIPEDTVGIHTELWLKGPAAAMLKKDNDTIHAGEDEGAVFRFPLPVAVTDTTAHTHDPL